MGYEAIQYETRGHVAVLTLNRPERLNAISPGLRQETHAAVETAWADDAVRALVVTGAGRGFCAGVDLTGARPDPGASQNERLDEFGWVGRWARLLHDFDKPVIAAVNGPAAGAGMSFALAADLRVGSPLTRFKTAFVERSLSPDSGLSYFLPRVIGYARAADLILTSRTVDADEAYRLGLIDRLVPAEDLVEAAVALAGEITQWPPLAVRSAKRVLQANVSAEFEAALKTESVGLGFARRAPNDARESLLAFTEKRKPTYTGQ